MFPRIFDALHQVFLFDRLIEHRNMDGETPLAVALSKGGSRAFRLLNFLGKSVDFTGTRLKDGQTLVHYAVLSEKPENLEV